MAASSTSRSLPIEPTPAASVAILIERALFGEFTKRKQRLRIMAALRWACGDMEHRAEVIALYTKNPVAELRARAEAAATIRYLLDLRDEDGDLTLRKKGRPNSCCPLIGAAPPGAAPSLWAGNLQGWRREAPRGTRGVSMEDDPLGRAVALSFLEHELMNEAAAYVSRGRAYKDLPTDQVEVWWIEAFRRWVGGESASQEMDDFAAELRLRGVETPPYDCVGPEIEMLMRKIAEAGPPSGEGPLGAKIDAFLKARNEPSG